MLDWLKQIDTKLFLLINRHHTPVVDTLMFYISDMRMWIPFYILLIILFISKFGFKKFLLIFGFIGLLILCTDQASVLVKNYVQRYRPSHNLDLISIVHIIRNYFGGQFGFVSSHATNNFGLAVFISIVAGAKVKGLTAAMLCYALIISYSRIYLGVHYPSDVIGGWILGSLIAFLIAKLYFFIDGKYFAEYKN